MADLHTFWNELDALPTEETPLTTAESDRLADAVLAKVHAESGEAPRKKSVHRAKSAKRRRVPVWGRALAGVAACMAVLCGVNTVNPALAEGLPFVGDVFSFLNQHDSKDQLKSDRLSGYAQQAAVPAVPESQSETAERQQRQKHEHEGKARAGKSLAQVGHRHGDEAGCRREQGDANEAQRHDGLVEHEEYRAEAEGSQQGARCSQRHCSRGELGRGNEAEGGGEHGHKRAESRPAMGVERHDAPGEQRGRDAEPGVGVVENRMGIEGQLQ